MCIHIATMLATCSVVHIVLDLFIIIIFHHEFRPGWPVSVSAVMSFKVS
jgi:hypothetical protein